MTVGQDSRVLSQSVTHPASTESAPLLISALARPGGRAPSAMKGSALTVSLEFVLNLKCATASMGTLAVIVPLSLATLPVFMVLLIDVYFQALLLLWILALVIVDGMEEYVIFHYVHLAVARALALNPTSASADLATTQRSPTATL